MPGAHPNRLEHQGDRIMAYLDIDDMFAGQLTTRSAAAAAPAVARFSPLEWSVIALAKRDGLRTLSAPGRLSRALGALFGGSSATALADNRLEALRRLAVYAWHRGFALPQAEIDRFLAAGFSRAHVEALLASVTGVRFGGAPRSAKR